MAGKKEVVSSRMPKVPGVKLDKDFFADLWWVGRVEDRAPGDILKEIAGTQVAARRLRHAAAIAELAKLDAEEDRIVSRSQERAAE